MNNVIANSKNLLFFFFALIVPLACGHSFEPEEKSFYDYEVTDTSSFPTATIELKSKKTGEKFKVSTFEAGDDLEFEENTYEIAMLEITEQIKYWFYAATAIGLAGAATDSESSDDFLILGGIGLIGSIATPIYQSNLLDKLQKLEKPESKPESDKGEPIDVDTSDFGS